jgi:hypothetical protein
MAILVPNDEREGAELVCLVRGQVENVEFEVNAGGSGSWYEVRGQDIRTRLNRKAKTFEFPGASDEFIANLIRECTNQDPVVGPAIKNYVDENYRCQGTQLDAIYEMARMSAFSFWLTYEPVKLNPKQQISDYRINTTGHFESSPDRHETEGTKPPTTLKELGEVSANPTAVLKILGDENSCETVLSFSTRIDNEIYRLALSHGQNLSNGEEEDNEVSTIATDLNPGGENPLTIGYNEGEMHEWGEPQESEMQVNTNADPQTAKWQAYAAATEASWYVRGEAMTTVHMLHQVLAPHAIVDVVGGGCGIAGKYQVSDITHVVTPAGHWMELSLRSNSRSLTKRLVTP